MTTPTKLEIEGVRAHLNTDGSLKLRKFIELTIARIRAQDGEGGGSTGSESSESSESSEGAEGVDILQSLIEVNPGPDEWGPLLALTEPLTRIASIGRR